jgi:hypothetical protein
VREIIDMTVENDPLSELLVDDAKSIDRARLAKYLHPYIRFDNETKEVRFLEDFAALPSNEARLEVALLASKAKALLLEEKEGIAPAELIEMQMMPAGSVKSTLKKLFDSKKIHKNSEGKYFIPNYRLSSILLERR